jgi:hypothetical protein
MGRLVSGRFGVRVPASALTSGYGAFWYVNGFTSDVLAAGRSAAYASNLYRTIQQFAKTRSTSRCLSRPFPTRSSRWHGLTPATRAAIAPTVRQAIGQTSSRRVRRSRIRTSPPLSLADPATGSVGLSRAPAAPGCYRYAQAIVPFNRGLSHSQGWATMLR